MRTPNTTCLLCDKPLYRRPGDMARTRYAACMACRNEAQKVAGITDAQQAGLMLGRPKGTNHRQGYQHRPESRRKTSESHKRWCAENPGKVAARGEKTRGAQHYRWNGGSSRLNISIRQMNENRRWTDAVRDRDGERCVDCGATGDLNSHHLVELAELIARLGIKSRDDARANASELWNLDNGVTLCEPCHYVRHGRARREVA